MTQPTPDSLRSLIEGLIGDLEAGDPPKPLAEISTIDGLQIDAGDDAGVIVRVSLAVNPEDGPAVEQARKALEQALTDAGGVAQAQIMLTAKKAPKVGQKPPRRAAPAGDGSLSFPNIKHIIAVGSGKGGVGKSTVALNLAAAWQQLGWSVGLLDADIYGPSVPTLTGSEGRPNLTEDKRIAPMNADGIRTMSIGNMTKPGEALVWRGPMVQGALVQMLRDVEWGELDALIIDLPPGTGDVQLTLTQKLKLTGAVIVSTPQDLALIDARRAMAMFEKVAVPILGMVENMSVFCCPNCDYESHIFGHGGAAAEASKQGLPFLGEVPLTMGLRQLADEGRSVVRDQPDDPAAEGITAIAAGLKLALEDPARSSRAAPNIIWR